MVSPKVPPARLPSDPGDGAVAERARRSDDGPRLAGPALTQGLVDALVGASLCLDGVERPAPGLRADEPAHRTATGRASSAVVVRPGWGGRPTLR